MLTRRPSKLGLKQQPPAQVVLLKRTARTQQVQQQRHPQQAGIAALRPAHPHLLPMHARMRPVSERSLGTVGPHARAKEGLLQYMHMLSKSPGERLSVQHTSSSSGQAAATLPSLACRCAARPDVAL